MKALYILYEVDAFLQKSYEISNIKDIPLCKKVLYFFTKSLTTKFYSKEYDSYRIFEDCEILRKKLDGYLTIRMSLVDDTITYTMKKDPFFILGMLRLAGWKTKIIK